MWPTYNGSGLKFGQVYGILSPRLRQILAEPLNLTPDPTTKLRNKVNLLLVIGSGLNESVIIKAHDSGAEIYLLTYHLPLLATFTPRACNSRKNLTICFFSLIGIFLSFGKCLSNICKDFSIRLLLILMFPPLLILIKSTVKIIPLPVPFNKDNDKGGYAAQYQSLQFYWCF